MTSSAETKATKHPAKVCESIYLLADLLTDIERLLAGTYGHPGLWRDLTPDRADALEAILRDDSGGSFDFLTTSKAVRDYADAWQAQIDGAAQ